MKTFKGSELNRLARRTVESEDRKYREHEKKASFQDWELILDSPPRLIVHYAVFERYRKPHQPRRKFYDAMISVTLN